jgi:hypothetical protein
VNINTPIGQVEFHVVKAKTPFLLCLADIDRLGVYLDNLRNVLITKDLSVPVVRRFGHSFLLWDTSLQSFLVDSFNYNPCFLTRVKLQRLYRRFGHPSINKLHRVLERAGHNVDKGIIKYLTKYYKQCQKHGQSPSRFKFSLKDDLDFNTLVIVDVFYLDGKPVLYIVNKGTSY